MLSMQPRRLAHERRGLWRARVGVPREVARGRLARHAQPADDADDEVEVAVAVEVAEGGGVLAAGRALGVGERLGDEVERRLLWRADVEEVEEPLGEEVAPEELGAAAAGEVRERDGVGAVARRAAARGRALERPAGFEQAADVLGALRVALEDLDALPLVRHAGVARDAIHEAFQAVVRDRAEVGLAREEVEVAVAVGVAQRGHAGVLDLEDAARGRQQRVGAERERRGLWRAGVLEVADLPGHAAREEVGVAVAVHVAEAEPRAGRDAAELARLPLPATAGVGVHADPGAADRHGQIRPTVSRQVDQLRHRRPEAARERQRQRRLVGLDGERRRGAYEVCGRDRLLRPRGRGRAAPGAEGHERGEGEGETHQDGKGRAVKSTPPLREVPAPAGGGCWYERQRQAEHPATRGPLKGADRPLA